MSERLSPDVMRPNEFRQRLGLSWSRFCEVQAAGKFAALLATGPSRALGVRVYSRRKIEAWINDPVPNARSPIVAVRLARARGPKNPSASLTRGSQDAKHADRRLA